MRLLPVRCGIAESLQEEKAVVDDDILLTSRQVWCRAFKNKSGNVFLFYNINDIQYNLFPVCITILASAKEEQTK